MKKESVNENNKRNTLFIGDQIFTDVLGAKRAGLYTIMVKPIHPKEEIQICSQTIFGKNRSVFSISEAKEKKC